MRRSIIAILATLLAVTSLAWGQSPRGTQYACEAEWAFYCDGDKPDCSRKDNIAAERSFSFDADERSLEAALYSAVFSGLAAVSVTSQMITASGLLAAPSGNPAGEIYVTMIIRPADARFSVQWRSLPDTGVTVAAGKCTVRPENGR